MEGGINKNGGSPETLSQTLTKKCICIRHVIACVQVTLECGKLVRGELHSLEKAFENFFRTKGFMRIIDGFPLNTKGFLQNVYEFLGSEMPLELVASILDIHECTVSKTMLYMPNNTEEKADLAPKRLSDE